MVDFRLIDDRWIDVDPDPMAGAQPGEQLTISAAEIKDSRPRGDQELQITPVRFVKKAVLLDPIVTIMSRRLGLVRYRFIARRQFE